MVAALGVGVMAGTASASLPASGASVVVQQNGVTTHTVCASQDVWLTANGFAPARREVQARVEIIGGGLLFTTPIHLTAGSGSVDVGTPGPGFIGDRFRVRYQVGNGHVSSLLGSFSATIVDC